MRSRSILVVVMVVFSAGTVFAEILYNVIELGYGHPYSINDNGQIVGSAQDGSWQAALFDATGSGANIDLNTLIDPILGWNLEVAYSINDNGWIVGTGINPDGNNKAYLLTPIPEPTTLLLLG